jgi:predicted metal-binding membrane protein
MSFSQVLSAATFIRPARRRGFCPACRGWDPGTVDQRGGAERELSPPALTAFALLAVAAVAWALTIWQSRSTGEMAMGLGSLASFATGWAVMMSAMMLPSALPFVYEFARRSEGRRRWQAATGMLAATYLGIWLGFGVACYFVLSAFPVPEADQGLVGGVALALAAVYGLTPIRAASETRCRELCCLHGPLPFSLVRSALVAGTRYGLSCVGCSAGLMAATAIIGMSQLGWVVILAGLLLVHKLGPAPSMGRKWLVSVALIAMAVVYASMA